MAFRGSVLFLTKSYLFIYLFLAVLRLWLLLPGFFSRVAGSGGCFLVAIHGLLIAGASLVVEYGFKHRFSSCGVRA